MPSDDEEEIFAGRLLGAQMGEPRASEELVRWLESPLLGFVTARGADDPDGTANEVLVRVFRSIGGFGGGLVQFRAWVFRIARNVLVDEHRRRAARARAVPSSPETLAEVVTVGDGLDRVGERERVETMLECLTDEQREVLLLRVVAGLSVDETARAIGRTRGAVSSMQYRALARLRVSMSESA